MTTVVCTGRGLHDETPLMVTSRYHAGGWDHAGGKPVTVPGESPSGYIPARPYEYIFRCRKCKPLRRAAFTPEQYAKIEASVLPLLDISYLR